MSFFTAQMSFFDCTDEPLWLHGIDESSRARGWVSSKVTFTTFYNIVLVGGSLVCSYIFLKVYPNSFEGGVIRDLSQVSSLFWNTYTWPKTALRRFMGWVVRLCQNDVRFSCQFPFTNQPHWILRVMAPVNHIWWGYSCWPGKSHILSLAPPTVTYHATPAP